LRVCYGAGGLEGGTLGAFLLDDPGQSKGQFLEALVGHCGDLEDGPTKGLEVRARDLGEIATVRNIDLVEDDDAGALHNRHVALDLRQIAKRTPGFTGADLANVLNEAALLTARSNMQFIDERAIDEAIDRVIAGPQKRTRVMNDHDKAVTAYHEAGHALAAAALNYTDPVTKVTILPRGRALGYTMVMPTEDRFNKTRNQLLDDLVYGMGGRVAEEIVFRDPSTGPANDIQQATKTARAMVTDYGMSDRIGMVKLGDADTEAFGHGSGEGPRAFSDETAAIIDEEVRRLLDNAMREAWRILSENRGVLDTLASRLLEEETLDEAQLAEIFKDVVKAPERPVWNYQSDAAVPGVVLGHPVGIKSEDEWKPVPVQGIDVSPIDVIGASGVEEEQE